VAAAAAARRDLRPGMELRSADGPVIMGGRKEARKERKY